MRNTGRDEDFRYAAMRKAWGHGFGMKSLTRVFLLQAVLMWMVSFPVQAAMRSATPATLGLLDKLGIRLDMSPAVEKQASSGLGRAIIEGRNAVIEALRASRAPESWLAMVAEVQALSEADEQRLFGEALPPGLQLIG